MRNSDGSENVSVDGRLTSLDVRLRLETVTGEYVLLRQVGLKQGTRGSGESPLRHLGGKTFLRKLPNFRHQCVPLTSVTTKQKLFFVEVPQYFLALQTAHQFTPIIFENISR